MEEATPTSEDPRESRANELYWSSDHSVNSIAEKLDVSKGTLYGLIRPLPSGLPCPECGGDLEYANRTARDRGLVVCPDCGLDEDEELVRQAWLETAGTSTSGAVAVDGRPRRGPRQPGGVPVPTGSRILVGVALLGVAAGLALALWGRRR